MIIKGMRTRIKRRENLFSELITEKYGFQQESVHIPMF